MLVATSLVFHTLLGQASMESTAPAAQEPRPEFVARVFNGVTKDTMHLLDEFYAEDIVFEDPLGRIEGLPALRAYYAGLYEHVTKISFEFTNHISDGDQYAGSWVMRMKTKSLNKGKEITVHGTSILHFNAEGKVDRHRDYFDLGEMVYRHVPIVGSLIGKVNKRLSEAH